jgi:RNA polymerase sigma-70 factor (ECF subfamily)
LSDSDGSDLHYRKFHLAELVEAVAGQRDASAFAELYGFFAPRLKAFGMRHGASPTVAEDLAQETMLAVWRRADTFDRTRATASTWVFTIQRNKRIDLQRREANRETVMDAPMIIADPRECPEVVAAAALGGHVLRRMLRNLPRKQMEVVQMAYYEGLSHREIAEFLGLPLGTVKSRIRLALARLKCPELAEQLH